ncbi:MurR/RpiR family transcriptional regulator [Neobacillus sp. M.A.Huq-85]
MKNSCIGKIQTHYPKLSEKEKKIANYILETPDKIIHRTINEVAEELNLADATVFRFCKRIGYKGYQAMKIALASEMTTPVISSHEEIIHEDNEKTILEKVFKSNIRTIEHTFQVNENESIHRAIELLSNANRVEFYGTGGSAVIALDAYYKFIQTGIKASATLDSHFQLMSASQLTKEDVAVVISHTGTNKDSLNILNTARGTGAKTIGITSVAKSPIGQKVDVALYTSSDRTEYRSESLASRIAQLSLIDALSVNLMVLNKKVLMKEDI